MLCFNTAVSATSDECDSASDARSKALERVRVLDLRLETLAAAGESLADGRLSGPSAFVSRSLDTTNRTSPRATFCPSATCFSTIVPSCGL
jgi:hypothetical protein